MWEVAHGGQDARRKVAGIRLKAEKQADRTQDHADQGQSGSQKKTETRRDAALVHGDIPPSKIRSAPGSAPRRTLSHYTPKLWTDCIQNRNLRRFLQFNFYKYARARGGTADDRNIVQMAQKHSDKSGEFHE